uniref:Uncharacterized protein n=1 Tax=Romanomermis culicivorax TaxID=13658 RepID=A0A915J6J7_ROMCU
MIRLIDTDLKNRLMYKVCYIFTNLTWFMCAGNNVFLDRGSNKTNVLQQSQSFDLRDRTQAIKDYLQYNMV